MALKSPASRNAVCTRAPRQPTFESEAPGTIWGFTAPKRVSSEAHNRFVAEMVALNRATPALLPAGPPPRASPWRGPGRVSPPCRGVLPGRAASQPINWPSSAQRSVPSANWHARAWSRLAAWPKAVRVRMIEAGLCRKEVNRRVRLVPWCFRWAVAEEMIRRPFTRPWRPWTGSARAGPRPRPSAGRTRG